MNTADHSGPWSVVTRSFYDEANREYVVTADVLRNGTVELWTGADVLELDELAAAIDRDPGHILDELRSAAFARTDTLPCPPAPILDQYAEICRIANVAAARCQRLSHDIRQALAMANSGRCEGLNRVLEARWQERCGKRRAA